MIKKNYLFSKKGKKQFDNLSDKDKQEVAKVAIADAVNKALRKHIPIAEIRGRGHAIEFLYQKHVKKLDAMTKGSPVWIENVENLLSDIRVGHLNVEKSKSGQKEAYDED